MRRVGLSDSNVSIRLSVTAGIVSKRRYFIISSPSDSPITSLSGEVWLIKKFARGHPERRRFVRLGLVQTGDFGDFSTYKPLYLQNGARYDQGYYWTLIGNRIRAFDWYHNQRPWMTLNWPWTAITHFLHYRSVFQSPPTKTWMKIDPYCQRQKCRPKITVSNNIRFMQIFSGVRWTGGVQWEWGRFFQRFSTSMSRYLENGAF